MNEKVSLFFVMTSLKAFKKVSLCFLPNSPQKIVVGKLPKLPSV